MATSNNSDAVPPPPSQFQARRSELLISISASLETVLQQVNRLNRTLEGIIEIGNEFGSVEALWSQFESVMGKTGEGQGGGEGEGEAEEETEQTIMSPSEERGRYDGSGNNQDESEEENLEDGGEPTVRLTKGRQR